MFFLGGVVTTQRVLIIAFLQDIVDIYEGASFVSLG